MDLCRRSKTRQLQSILYVTKARTTTAVVESKRNYWKQLEDPLR